MLTVSKLMISFGHSANIPGNNISDVNRPHSGFSIPVFLSISFAYISYSQFIKNTIPLNLHTLFLQLHVGCARMAVLLSRRWYQLGLKIPKGRGAVGSGKTRGTGNVQEKRSDTETIEVTIVQPRVVCSICSTQLCLPIYMTSRLTFNLGRGVKD